MKGGVPLIQVVRLLSLNEDDWIRFAIKAPSEDSNEDPKVWKSNYYYLSEIRKKFDMKKIIVTKVNMHYGYDNLFIGYVMIVHGITKEELYRKGGGIFWDH